MSELVTEAMIEAAKSAQAQVPLGPGCDDRLLRAALSAVAPLIAAREREECAKLADHFAEQNSKASAEQSRRAVRYHLGEHSELAQMASQELQACANEAATIAAAIREMEL